MDKATNTEFIKKKKKWFKYTYIANGANLSVLAIESQNH